MSVFADQMAENIYRNGIDLVTLGILDAQMVPKDARRGLSAVLNAYAGLLLLLKAKLAQESAATDYSLLCDRMQLRQVMRNGQSVWIGPKNIKKTVDFRQIQENFAHLQSSECEWKNFWTIMERLQKFRNDVEHKYSTENQKTIMAYLADVKYATDFILCNAVGADPSEELAEVWQFLSLETAIAERLREQQKQDFAALKWLHPRLPELIKAQSCAKCEYPIILLADTDVTKAIDATFKCGSCNAEIAYEDLIETVLRSQYFDEEFRWMDEWHSDRHICTCPACSRYGFDTNTSTCYCCGDKHEYVCDLCQESLTAEEIEALEDMNPCVYCAHCRYMMSKDD